MPPALPTPLPPRRPPDVSVAAPVHEQPSAGLALPAPTPMPPVPDPACGRVLASKILVVAAAPPVSGPNGCGIAAPVTLQAVILRDGTRVPFEPHALIRCDLAEALGGWVHDDIAPAVQSAGGLAKILGSNGYECRLRNRLQIGKLSEHAKGNALDLVGLVLRNGHSVFFAKDAPEKPAFLAQLKTAACNRFMTVLGPGADASHEAHLHVDLERRHRGFRICEWNVN